jgi:succinyl-CoA synthetase beta subunit
MNIHEYQAKSILKKFGVAVPLGFVIEFAKDGVKIAEKITKETNTNTWAVKAQIHAGGRGKGGGVKIAKSINDVKQFSKEILGMNLVSY